MKKVIEYQEYIAEKGIKLSWESNHVIKCTIENNSIIISANKQGLLSLANHLITLAQDAIPAGNHLHFDEYNSLENGSKEVIVCKVE